MKKYIIELIGTFFLVLIIGLTENPIAIGLGLAVLVYMGAHISGAHYNPVVTLAMYINDQIDLKESGKYIASQLTGSVVAVYTMIGLGQDSFSDFLRFESMLSNFESSKETKIKMVKKINNSFSNLNFQIDKLTEKQEITPE